jgi:hypothetical protein
MFVRLLRRWGVAIALYVAVFAVIVLIRRQFVDGFFEAIFVDFPAEALVAALGALAIARAVTELGVFRDHPAPHVATFFVTLALWVAAMIALLRWIIADSTMVLACVVLMTAVGAASLRRPSESLKPVAWIVVATALTLLAGAWFLTPQLSARLYVAQIGPMLRATLSHREKTILRSGIYVVPPDIAAFPYDAPPLAIYRVGYLLYDARDEAADDAAARFKHAFFRACDARARRIEASYYDLRVLCP